MANAPLAASFPLSSRRPALRGRFGYTAVLAVVTTICLAAGATAQTYQVLKAFPTEGEHPQAGLIQGTDGNLYGTTPQGGEGGHGTIFKLDADGTTLTTLHDFVGAAGGSPHAALIQGADGNLYGTTFFGGSGYGTVFKLDTGGVTFTTLHSFSSFDGANPYAGVVQGTDGKLYGTTNAGGAGSVGTIFSVGADGTAFSTLHHFANTDGAYPHAGLVQATDGNLYGATTVGGASGFGTVFRIDTAGTTLVTLHDFLQTDGASPYASLIQVMDGHLYGTTINGGANGDGTVFRIATNGTLLTLHDFLGPDGANPRAPLIQAADGNLYGTTLGGGAVGGYGTIFKIDTNGTMLTTVHSFLNTDGADLYAGVVQGTDGNLYGTTSTGNVSRHYGTVFKIDTNGTALTTLHGFRPFPEGSTPEAGLIQATDGSLYGTTYQNGANGFGTIFKVDAGGATFQTLHNFAFSDGARPQASLIQAMDGNLYGTTFTGGGGNGKGTIFRIDTGGSTFTTLHIFSGGDGSSPYSGVLQAADGNLYGTTESGGANVNFGTIFRIDVDGTTLTTLHSFAGADGANPFAGLIQGTDGYLYGTTTFGGANGPYGTIFRVDTNGTTLTTLHDFAGGDGANPYGDLIQGADGILYGTTLVGGENAVGTVFRIHTDGSNFETLHVFDSSDGAGPDAGLIQGADGYLYGTTTVGGTGNCSVGCGTVFRIDTNGTTLTTLHGFDPDGGGGPRAGVIQAGDTSLYGTTAFGGPADGGVVFRLALCSLSQPPVVTTTHCVAPSSSGLTASVVANPGDTYSWTIAGGTIDSGQGTNAISFTAGGPGTRITLSVDETSAQGCLGTGAAALQVDFNDVPSVDPFYTYVCAIGRDGITAGCGSGDYCRDAAVRRGQMAVFLVKAEHGSSYVPPACIGVFPDVPCPSPFADWIEQLFNEGMTAGCGGGDYCPDNPVTRAQMAVFLLKTSLGSQHVPPACTGTVFLDVPCSGGAFDPWIEDLAGRGITGGCGGGFYCPGYPNTRGQMAVFIVKTFGLP
jgi:uncharacterized repeat protein (TIGR03803 family)